MHRPPPPLERPAHERRDRPGLGRARWPDGRDSRRPVRRRARPAGAARRSRKRGIHFDFSKTHLEPRRCSTPSSRSPTAPASPARRDALFAGEIVNPTEGRAAEHSAERGQGAPESVARAAGFHARMRTLIDAIEAEAFGPVRHILHIGIGGSALGPEAADRRARPRRRPLRRRDRLQRRRRRARGGDRRLRSARDPAGRSPPRPSPPARRCSTPRSALRLAGGGRRRRSLWPGRSRSPPARTRRSSSASTRPASCPSPRRVGGRYSLWSSIGFPGRAGARLGRVREPARGRGGDGPPFPPRAARGQRAGARRLRRPLLRQRPRRRDARGLRL